MKKYEITVGLADMKIARSPEVLVAYALGSCVAVILYDPVSRVSGLAHIMLPFYGGYKKVINRGKFADTAIETLVSKMARKGADEKRIIAKIAGGAKMFNTSSDSPVNVGQRNIDKVKETLKAKGIYIKAEDTGGNFARTVRFFSENCRTTVSSAKFGTKEL
jgi:chemotaxis protein CheD